MRKALLLILVLILGTNVAYSAQLWVSTISECDVQQVQDVAIDVFTGKNFTIADVTPYKMEFQKNFGDGFWVAARNQTVRINLLARDGNVKMLVTQVELVQGRMNRKRPIDHLIPMLKEIKHAIDGTPVQDIQNEAENQLPGSGNEREKTLGLVLANQKNREGYATIKEIKMGSLAYDAKLQVLDAILELNGRDTKDMDIDSIRSYITNRIAKRKNIIITYRREGKIAATTIRPSK